MQNFTESRRKTKDRVLGLGPIEEEKKEKKKQFRLKDRKIKKKEVNVFAKTRKEFSQIEDELYNIGIMIPVQTFLALWLGIAIGGSMLLMLIRLSNVVCIGFAVIAAVGPYLFIRSKRKKRREQLEEQLIEGITTMCNVLRAGHSFQTAMNNIAEEMEGPLAEEFGRVSRETQRGMSLDASMNAMSERIGSSDLDMLCQTILIQRQVGGNLAEVLEKIADTVRSRMDLKEEIKTLTSSGKMSGYIIGALPIILLILISIVNPTYAKVMFVTFIGRILLVISAVMEIIGFIIINKIVDIKY
jgi:tight adherence protein B